MRLQLDIIEVGDVQFAAEKPDIKDPITIRYTYTV